MLSFTIGMIVFAAILASVVVVVWQSGNRTATWLWNLLAIVFVALVAAMLARFLLL